MARDVSQSISALRRDLGEFVSSGRRGLDPGGPGSKLQAGFRYLTPMSKVPGLYDRGPADAFGRVFWRAGAVPAPDRDSGDGMIVRTESDGCFTGRNSADPPI